MKTLNSLAGWLLILGLYIGGILSAAVVFLLALSQAVLDVDGENRPNRKLAVTSTEVTYLSAPAESTYDR
jgi:hypothetical protein